MMIKRTCPVCEQDFDDQLNSVEEITASFRCEKESGEFPWSALGCYSLRIVNGVGHQVVVCSKCMVKVLRHSLACAEE